MKLAKCNENGSRSENTEWQNDRKLLVNIRTNYQFLDGCQDKFESFLRT